MARWQPLSVVGGSYADDCLPWSHQDTVNYIPVPAEKSGARSSEMLRCVPGFATFCNLGTNAPIRGARNVEGRLFVVSGQTLFSISTTGAATALGTIPGVQRCSLSHNQITGGNEVAISNGQAGYVYNTATGTLAQITDDGFPGAICFDFVDGYITGIEPGRRFAFISDLAAATSYNTLDQFEAEGSPDLLRGQAITHREWWLMGERTIEPFVNEGTATGTFQRAQGTVIEVGLAATFAVAVMDNSVFWLGNDGIVYRANGYTPSRISTHAIEQAIARCNMAQAFAFTFEDRGHKVFYLTLPDGQTWGYDAATGEWHRRQSYGLNRWRINTLTRWNGYWIAGDFNNGKLYVLDWNIQQEAGQPLERRRITGAFHDSQNSVIVNALELVVDTGTQAESYSALLPAVKISGNLPDGPVGQAVNYQYILTGGVKPVTLSIASGALPTGLSISSAGLVTGTPTAIGSYTWTLRVTDSDGSAFDLADTATMAETLSNAILADSPVAYWKADEASGTVMSDASGNGHNATYYPGASLIQRSTPLRLYSLGSVEMTAIGLAADISSTGIDVTASASWAMECVVQCAPTGGGTSPQMFGGELSSTGFGSCLWYSGQSAQFAGGEIGSALIGSPTATRGSVVHLILECNGTAMNLYENGQLVKTRSASSSTFFRKLNFLGRTDYPANNGFVGKGSDFAIYNHAIGAARALYHAQAAGLA